MDLGETEVKRRRAADMALFDPSKEAILARKYEAAAERCYFRCLKELKEMRREARRSEEATPPQAGEDGGFVFPDSPGRASGPPSTPFGPRSLAGIADERGSHPHDSIQDPAGMTREGPR